jgi:hypothetical protein
MYSNIIYKHSAPLALRASEFTSDIALISVSQLCKWE